VPARQAESLRHVGPEDQVLFLGIPAIEVVREVCARALSVVCVGDRDAVYEARKAARDLRNVMFHPGEAEEIPFDDACLTRVIGLSGSWDDPKRAAAEVARVLVGGGLALIGTENSEAFQAIGLKEESAVDGLAVFRKPDDPQPEFPPMQFTVLR
jgi:SAM-dependent methyltransferase